MNIFIIIWTSWFLSEIFLHRIFRSTNNRQKSTDKVSLKLVWLTITFSILLGIVSMIFLQKATIKLQVISYLGLILIVIGMAIRLLAIKTLGRFFTVNIGIEHEHRVIKNGLYKYIRHPSYTGSLLSFLGFGLSLNNWISLAIVFIPVFSSFVYRINVEENLLLTQFGTVYKDYIKQTKRLLPFIY